MSGWKGCGGTGRFLHEVRRVATKAEFFRVCEAFLDHGGAMPLEPFPIAFKEADVMAGEHL